MKERKIHAAKALFKPRARQSYTSISMFQQCIQKYVFMYLYKLQPKTINKNLVGGRAFHVGQAILLSTKGVRKKVLNKALKGVDKVFDESLATTEAMIGDTVEVLEYTRCQIRSMIRGWSSCYSKLPFKVIDTEKQLWAKKDITTKSPTIDRLDAVVDGIVVVDGNHAVLENKTTSAVDPSVLVANIELDFQGHLYISVVNKRIKLKSKINRYVYNYAVKPKLRLGKDETWTHLEDRMFNKIVEDYTKYFALMPVIVDSQSIVDTLVNVTRIIKRIDSLTPSQVECNSGQCFAFSGCQFAPLCKSHVKSGDSKTVYQSPFLSMFKTKER